MRKAFPTFVLLLMLAALPLLAADNPLPTLKIDRFQLSNGLTVFLVEDHSTPLVAVNVNYQVGSKNERPGRTGFAHLFEHMMFQGSKNWNKNYAKPLQEVGGQVNGGTSTDRTLYWETVPSSYLELALWLEADRMGFLLDAVSQERLDNQRSVVQNERRQRYENQPYGLVEEKIAQTLFPPNHPYNWTTIGSMADLSAASLDDVKDFFRSYYTPNNASLCLAGDFDPKLARTLVEKYFGGIPPGPPVSRIAQWTPVLNGEVSLELQDRVQLPRAIYVWPTVPVYAAQDAALDAFGQILGGGKTSRLYQRLVREKELAQSVVAYQGGRQVAGTFRIVLNPRPGVPLAELEQAARAVLDETLQNGITAEELERVQTTATANTVAAMENPGGFGGIADQVNSYFHFTGDPDRFRWDLSRTLDLTPERVNAAARQYLGPNRLVARVSPFPAVTAGASDAASQLDRTVMPGAGPDRPLVVPARQHFKLANGLEVVLAEQHKLPLVEIVLVVRSGSTSDPQDKPGLNAFVADLLTEGANGKSAEAIARSLERIGANINTSGDTEATVVELSTLRSRLDEALGIYADVITRPDFPADEFKQQKARKITSLKQAQDQPAALATEVLTRVLASGTPYGHTPDGTITGLDAITLDDLKAAFKKTFVPANATLVVVGDVTRADLETRLNQAFGAWKGGPAPQFEAPAPASTGTRTIYLVNKPGAAQSMIAAGHLGVPRRNPNFAAMELFNTVVGGTSVSRLNLNLREQKGYTYGARSGFQYFRSTGLFTATAPVQTKVTADAVKELVAEFEGILGQKPISEKELAAAKGSMVDGYGRRFVTLAGVAAEIGRQTVFGLPDSDLESYPKTVRALGLADVTRVGAQALQPGKLAIVVVGDAQAIRSDLEKMQLGPVVELDKDGKPVQPQ